MSVEDNGEYTKRAVEILEKTIDDDALREHMRSLTVSEIYELGYLVYEKREQNVAISNGE
jgi:hypothetical protein